MTVESAYILLHTVEPVFGAFFDAVTSIDFYTRFLERQFAQEQIRRRIAGTAGPDALNPTVVYAVDVGMEKPEYVHAVPFLKFQRRSAKNGPTTVLLGNSVVVELCALWENRFRAEIAAEIGVEVDQLKVSLFGDLRLLRNAMLHSSGLLQVPVSRLEVVDWVTPEARIEFDEGKVIWLSEKIREFAHEAERLRPTL